LFLSRHGTDGGARWYRDGALLEELQSLGALLRLPRADMLATLREADTSSPAVGPVLAPLDLDHEVWASGVTYLRSREARRNESAGSDLYDRVYEAERPELFFKAPGWRVVPHGSPVGIRHDSSWNVPEPELVLVVNQHLEIVGYTIGNDVSSRSIEGENALYLPQAKVFDRACAIGPRIWLPDEDDPSTFEIRMTIRREGRVVFEGEVTTRQMRRSFAELVSALGSALSFPKGALLMTGTGVVPPDAFTLHGGDMVTIRIEPIGELENDVG
jgi:2-dehydro-3-deoxy-D-arabinonate dehydratase